jgi:hypothetical protein
MINNHTMRDGEIGMTKATFTATIQKDSEKSATGIPVPPEALAALGTKKNPPVIVTLPGYTYRSSVGTVNGAPMISLSAEHREAAGVKAGDTVEVTLELDQEPRTIEIPADLAAALAATPDAAEAFDALAFSKRKEFVRQVNEAKAQETRERRIAGIVAKVTEA